MIRVLVIALAFLSCAEDYKTPAVGSVAAGQLEACRTNRYEPCGWVRAYYNVERDNELGVLELCVLWPDRIGPYPVGLERSTESLYGESELSTHERFKGIPLCKWQCPSMSGCNAYNGCACLDGAQ